MKKLLIGSSSLFVATGMIAFAGAASAATGAQFSGVTHAPMIRAKMPAPLQGNGHGHGGGGGGGGGGGSTATYGWTSSNWSGYALSGATGAYNSVSGNWTVPTVTTSKGSAYSSTWVGIDGFNNSNLIQTGTEQDYSNGTTHYYAWWEILPAAETVITTALDSNGNSVPATVQPGDQMTAQISQVSGTTWNITITDVNKWTFTTTQNYTGPGSSAEWIEEAPTIGGHVATLANYGRATIDPDSVNGANPGLSVSEDGAMVQKHSLVSVPSLPDVKKDGFTMAYGSQQVSPPAGS